MTWLHEGDGYRLRLARPDDDASLRALMRAVPMDGDLVLAQEREPSFFAFTRLHAPGVAETYVAEDEGGRLVGCGTHVVRDAWWPDGARRPVGYICDLRMLPGWRGARVLPEMGRVALERARDEHGSALSYTAVFDGNRRVVGTATSRRLGREHQPVSRPMMPYHMVNVQFAGRLRPRAEGVESATPADLDELAAFLAQGQRGRTFGYVLDRKLLETRLDTWPGLRVEDFLVARDRTGRIAGCCAPWAPDAVKQSRVLGYRGGVRAYRVAYNAYARLRRGATPLPPAGGTFRYPYLSHLEVADDDPVVLARLVRAAYRRLQAHGLHFLAAMVPRMSSLQRAFRGLVAHRTPMTLYMTSLVDGAHACDGFTSTRPGFEMALA